MSLADQYRQHADECISLARSIDNPADKAVLLQMAQAWRHLADRAQGDGNAPTQDRD